MLQFVRALKSVWELIFRLFVSWACLAETDQTLCNYLDAVRVETVSGKKDSKTISWNCCRMETWYRHALSYQQWISTLVDSAKKDALFRDRKYGQRSDTKKMLKIRSLRLEKKLLQMLITNQNCNCLQMGLNGLKRRSIN